MEYREFGIALPKSQTMAPAVLEMLETIERFAASQRGGGLMQEETPPQAALKE